MLLGFALIIITNNHSPMPMYALNVMKGHALHVKGAPSPGVVVRLRTELMMPTMCKMWHSS